jgi:predicted dehydrogenase
MLAGAEEVELVGVWARRPEAAAELAATSGTEAVAELDDLVERSEAVAFSVPPSVQPEPRRWPRRWTPPAWRPR